MTVKPEQLPKPLETHYQPQLVSIDTIQPNPWNPNVMPSYLFEELLNDMRQNGFIGGIICRRVETQTSSGPLVQLQIVDGEHRWRAAQTLGYKELPVIVQDYEDDQAKFNTFRWNHERGMFDVQRTGDLIRNLRQRHTIDDLVKQLGMNQEEMVQYLRKDELPATWHPLEPPASRFIPSEKEPIILGYAEPEAKKKLLDQLDKYREPRKLDRVQAVTTLLKSAESAKIGIGESPRSTKPTRHGSK